MTSAKWVLLVVCLGVRIALAFTRDGGSPAHTDEALYVKVAQALVDEHRFAVAPNGQPEVVRGPLYPAYLAAWLAIVGQEHLVLFALLGQAFLGTGTAWCLASAVGLILRQEGLSTSQCWRGEVVALALLAISPPALFWERTLMSEGLAAFCAAATTTALVRALISGRMGWAITAGLAHAALVLVKPVYAPLVVLYAWILGTGRPERRTSGIVYLAIVAAALVPWAWRNHVVADRFLPSGIGGGVFLFAGTMESSKGELLVRSPDEARFVEELNRYLALDTPVAEKIAFDRRSGTQAVSKILAEPLGYLYLSAKRMVRLWATSHTETIASPPFFVRAVMGALLGAIAFASLLLGVATLVDRRRLALMVLVSMPVFATLIHAPLSSGGRYSVPVWPHIWATLVVALALAPRASRKGAAIRAPSSPDPCPACLQGDAQPWTRKAGHDLWRCRSCGALFASSAGVHAEMEELYTRYYDRAPTPVPPAVDASLHRLVRGAEGYRQTGRWLDMGYGEGALLSVAQSEGWRCHGTEVASDALAVGRSRGWVVSRDTQDPQQFPPHSFDVVTLVETLEHVAEPRALLEDAARLLRGGGLLYLTTPNANSLNRRILGARWSVVSPPEHLTLWTARGLVLATSAMGFKVRRLRTEGLNPSELLARLEPRAGKPVDRNQAAIALNTALSGSRWRRGCKSSVNAGLSLVRLGDTLKLWALRTVD